MDKWKQLKAVDQNIFFAPMAFGVFWPGVRASPILLHWQMLPVSFNPTLQQQMTQPAALDIYSPPLLFFLLVTWNHQSELRFTWIAAVTGSKETRLKLAGDIFEWCDGRECVPEAMYAETFGLTEECDGCDYHVWSWRKTFPWVRCRLNKADSSRHFA